MKLIRKIIFVLVGLCLLFLCVLLFTRKEHGIEHSIVVDAPQSEVYNYLKFLKNTKEYNSWIDHSSILEEEFSQEDGNEGAFYQWKSSHDRMISGRISMLNLQYPSTLEAEMVLDNPYNIVSNHAVEIVPVGDRCKITWKVKAHFPFPYNVVFLSKDYENMASDTLKSSLKNIKIQLEK